MTGEERL